MDEAESLSQKIARIRKQVESGENIKDKKGPAKEKKTSAKATSHQEPAVGADDIVKILKCCKRKTFKERLNGVLSEMLCTGLVLAILTAAVFLLIALGRWVFSLF